MELYQEILLKVLEKEEIQVVFPNLNINAAEIVELTCYQALQNIKALIENPALDDTACFHQIEEVIRILEESGSGNGARHDFG